MAGFKDLEVWQRAKDIAVSVYKITSKGNLSTDYALKDQIRRSAVSVASNLAEGDERETDKESIRFFYYAKGSVAELRTQIQIAYEIGYINENIFKTLDDECAQIGRMIGALIRSREQKSHRLRPRTSNLAPLASSLMPRASYL